MKLLVIGCVLASASSANLDGLGSGLNFERTPNNNLVQKTYTRTQGVGLYGNDQFANSNTQRYGYTNQNNNQYVNVVSYNNREQLFNNAVTDNQNQRYIPFNQNQFNRQNQGYSQLNQQNQRFNPFGQFDNRNTRNQQDFRNQGRQGHSLTDSSFTDNGNQQVLQNLDGHDQVTHNQQRERAYGRYFQPCHSKVNDWYIECLKKCDLLTALDELACNTGAWAARENACWAGSITAPVLFPYC